MHRGILVLTEASSAPETLMHPLEELEQAYLEVKYDAAFQAELNRLLHEYVGRPTPLYFAERLTRNSAARDLSQAGGSLHTGAHKINNALGQTLLARRMGKKRIIAETGAGQHGVATATVCALFGLECVVYMGAEDMRRQALNVFRMRLLGAEVRRRRAAEQDAQGSHQRGHARLGDQCRDPITSSASCSGRIRIQ